MKKILNSSVLISYVFLIAETIFTYYEKVMMRWEYSLTSKTNERVFIINYDQITEI